MDAYSEASYTCGPRTRPWCYVGEGERNYSMTTEAQINANSKNAEQSTGPRTEEGKARTHLNALKHGRRAKLVVLPWENQDDFDDLCDEFEDGFKPANVVEQAMVEKMVDRKST